MFKNTAQYMYTILCKSLIHLIFFNTNFVLDVYFMASALLAE